MCFCVCYYGIYVALFRFQRTACNYSIDVLYYCFDSSVALQILIECGKEALLIGFCSANYLCAE